MNILRRLANSTTIDRLSLLMARAAAVVLLAMMALVVLEVGLRESAGLSTRCAHEYSGYLLVAVAFWGAAEVSRGNRHIRVSVLTDRLRASTQTVLNRICHVLALVLVTTLFIASAELVLTSAGTGMLTMGVYQMPVFIPQLAIPLGLAFFVLQLVISTIRVLLGVQE